MTSFLSLEASSDMCSVTLVSKSICQSLESAKARSHSQLLLPFIDELLDTNNISLKDLDFIACSQGPGSFTGLRICFSVAQGLAYGAKLPMITVCSLESMAQRCLDAHYANEGSCTVISVLDARMDQVYWAAFAFENGALKTIVVPQLQFIEEACEQISLIAKTSPLSQVSVVGSGLALLQGAGLDTVDMLVSEKIMPHSETSSTLAAKKWHQDQAVLPDQAELVYLRDTVSWKKRVKIRSS